MADSNTSLLEIYRAHSEDERRILQVLSIIYTPVNQTTLQRVLRTLGWKDKKGTALGQLMGKPLRERLLEEGLVSTRNNLLRCHPDIEEALTQETVVQGSFGEIVRAVNLTLLGLVSRHTHHQVVQAREQRKIRNAFYGGSELEILKALGIDKKDQDLPSGRALPLLPFCIQPLEPQWFDRLPELVKLHVLADLLTQGTLELQDQQWIYALLEQEYSRFVARNRGAAYVLAEQRLWRGRLGEVESLLADDDSGRALALRGWLCFQQGDDAASIAYFEAALKAMRKQTRKRNVYVPGPAGAFYLLALIASGDPQHLKVVQKQAQFASRAAVPDPFAAVFRLIDELVAILRGERKFEQCISLSMDSMTYEPYTDLFQQLILGWVGQKPKEAKLGQLVTHCQKAQQAQLWWFARQSAQLLKKRGRRSKCAPQEMGDQNIAVRDIIDLIKPRQPWEIALQALQDITRQVPGDDTLSSNQADQRMVWHLYCYDGICGLEPREQKRSKRGGWTKGRPVALRRLYDELDSFDYLSEQDRRICHCIQPETSYEYFGRYAKTTYDLGTERSLLAAVGHPLIFWAEKPDVLVELVQGEPVLEIQKRGQRLSLRLTPFPQEPYDVVAHPEGPRRVRVVTFDAQHQRIAGILGETGLTVPSSAKTRVMESIAAIAPLLNVHSEIGGGEAAGARSVEADHCPHIRLQPIGDGLKLECFIQPFAEGGPLFHPGRGAATVLAEIEGKQLQTTRDLETERQAVERVLTRCPLLVENNAWEWQLDDPEDALDTLLEFQKMGDAVTLDWPQGRKIRLSGETGITQMQVSVRKQRDWFSLEGGLRLDDGRVMEMTQLLELIAESPGHFVRLGEGEFLNLTQELRKRLEEIRAFSDQGRFHPLAATTLEDLTEGMQVKAAKAWRDQLARLNDARDLRPEVPSTLQAELRDYQHEGFGWLARLAQWGAGACLADDMGLGKTVQALALILSRAHEGPTLVLAPTSVAMNWLEEASRFAPTLVPRRFGPGDRQRMLDEAGAFDIVVCSYGLLQSESKRLSAVRWHTIVADEAQAIKNAFTKRSKAAMALSGDFRMITTGTPIENHLGELWNLFRFINPGLLGSLERFNQRFALPIESNNDREARQRLKKLIRPFILRRLKSDVLTELPPRTEITLHVELSDAETALYEALRRQAMERMAQPQENPGQQRVRALAEIMRLRRACCNPRLVMPETDISSAKLQAFAEIVEELRDNRHKALVFSQFVGHLALIREYLDAQGVSYQYLDGSTSTKNRKTAIDAFQAGRGELFLISLKAGGQGLNLTAADYVIHLDPWWNPAVEDQASDRAHRIGQQRPVTVYRLVARGTIEDKIVGLHRYKRDLADSLLEGSEMSGRMTVEDMLALIREGQG
ncbi:MAG: DEAD/DEAH box helicase [Pseudomonadota bacterium]